MKRAQLLFLSLVAVLLVPGIVVSPRDSFAVPFQVQVLETNYTTSVYTRWQDENGVIETSRENSSSTPISDYIYDEALFGTLTVSAEAEAQAGLFELSVSGSTKVWLAVASAKTEVTFSPVIDGSQNLAIDFAGYYEYYFSDGYVSLFDLTSNEELWNYWWSYPGEGTVPWESGERGGPGNPTATAALRLDTDFDADHTYALTMFERIYSNGEGEVIMMQLSGLDVVSVPEPSTLLLLGAAFAVLAGFREKFARIKTAWVLRDENRDH